jgi:hypothetical protein
MRELSITRSPIGGHNTPRCSILTVERCLPREPTSVHTQPMNDRELRRRSSRAAAPGAIRASPLGRVQAVVRHELFE